MLVMVGIATMQPVFRMHRHCAESSQAPSHLVPQQPYFTDGNSEAHKGWEPGPSLPYLWMVELGATSCWTRAWAGGTVNPERPPRLELFSSPHPKPALWQNVEPEPALTLTLAVGQIPWGLQREGKLGIT